MLTIDFKFNIKIASCLDKIRLCKLKNNFTITLIFILSPEIHVSLFLSVLEKGLDHIAENILSYLDADSLRNAELVCKEWFRVISEGMLWKKLIERKVRTVPLWRGLAERRGW